MGGIVSTERKFKEYRIARQPCVETMTLGLSVNGRQAYEPTTKIVNEITTALTQPNINIVGVYGSGDATKHIVMQQITRRVQRDGVFDVILMASIVKKNTCWSRWTKSPDVRRIQDELGNMLGLQLQEKTLKERANQLCDWIKMKDKILIILMPIWGGIDLGKIGIPLGNHHKGCKILLVAESEEVLSNQMNAPQMNICMSL